MSLDSTSQLGQVLAKNINDTQDVAAAVSPDEDSPQTFRLYDETLILEQGPLKATFRNISTDSIWDSAVWDTDVWEGGYDNDPYLVAVVNKDYRFIDRLNSSDYIDTTLTDATVNTGNIVFVDSDTKSYYSEVIAYEPEDSTTYKDITSVTPNLFGTDVDGAYIYAKTDTNDWELCTINTKKVLTNPGEKLYLKIENWDSSASGDILVSEAGDTLTTEAGDILIMEQSSTQFAMTITDIECIYTTT